MFYMVKSSYYSLSIQDEEEVLPVENTASTRFSPTFHANGTVFHGN